MIPSARGDPSGFQPIREAIPVTNAQRRAAWHARRKAEMDSLRNDTPAAPLRNDSKPETTPKPGPGSAFCPHEAGSYYLASVRTVGTFKMFARDFKPPVYTYGITTVRFELNPDTGTWIWFDGEKNQFPRRTPRWLAYWQQEAARHTRRRGGRGSARDGQERRPGDQGT